MKKVFFLAIFGIAFSLTACNFGSKDEVTYTEQDLIGTWKEEGISQDVYVCFTGEKDATGEYRYGYEWNESEDVFPEDLKKYGDGWFKWKLVKPNLTEIHLMDNGGADIPKVYKVLKLTDTTLEYQDDYKNIHKFSKVIIR